MISEYALDPELVVRWHDPREWAFFREAFSECTGRFGSTFPRQNTNKWRQGIFKAFRERFPEETKDSRAWQRMDTLLECLTKRMIDRDRGDATDGRWLEKVLEEHQRRPFKGILSTDTVPGVGEVLTPEMLLEDRPPAAWSVPSCPPVPRTAPDFASALRPLLLRCREAVFVDPWFNPQDPRFTEPLRAMLEELWGEERSIRSPTAQLITAEGSYEEDQGRRNRNRDAQWLLGECKRQLPRILPSGRHLTVTVLKKRDGGQKIHNRYVLTLFCGVSFGTGLDVAASESAVQTDDICRLSREQLDERWKQYVNTTARARFFEVAAGPEEIFATR